MLVHKAHVVDRKFPAEKQKKKTKTEEKNKRVGEGVELPHCHIPHSYKPIISLQTPTHSYNPLPSPYTHTHTNTKHP